MADDKLYHTYHGTDEYESRTAVVKENKQGFYVVLANNGLRVDKIPCYEKSVHWAESVAENYVDEILNPK